MKQIGYINLNELTEFDIKKQKDTLNGLGVETIIYEFNALENLTRNKEVLIYDLNCFDKPIIQRIELLEYFNENNIELTIVNKESKLYKIQGGNLVAILIELMEVEREIIRQRTLKGLTKARGEGRVGGRPRVSEETIEQIRELRQNQLYNLREISEECGVSLGTVYKYTQSDRDLAFFEKDSL